MTHSSASAPLSASEMHCWSDSAEPMSEERLSSSVRGIAGGGALAAEEGAAGASHSAASSGFSDSEMHLPVYGRGARKRRRMGKGCVCVVVASACSLLGAPHSSTDCCIRGVRLRMETPNVGGRAVGTMRRPEQAVATKISADAQDLITLVEKC